MTVNLLRHVLISVCCGEPGRPCGALLGPEPLRTVPERLAGMSHGLCRKCSALTAARWRQERATA